MAIGALHALQQVFADLPHVMFCVKDTNGRYTACNDGFVRRTGKKSEHQILGKRAGDLFPRNLAASYEAQDRAVFETGVPVRFQLEVITDAGGSEDWYLTNKQLIADGSDEQVLCVVSVMAELPKRTGRKESGVRRAIDYARANFTEALRVDELADLAGLSVAQFERATHKALGVSPKQFIQQLRCEHASTLLVTTDHSIAEIAEACGYYDQSQFTRLFRTATGMTPGAYRNQ